MWGGLTGVERRRLHRYGETVTASGDGVLLDHDTGEVVIVPADESLPMADARALLTAVISDRHELVAAS